MAAVTTHALRRALARARAGEGRVRRRGGRADGRARRGPRATDRDRRPPPRSRLGRPRHVLAQGLHPAHDAVSRSLPLLHVREAAREARGAVPHAGGGARDRRGEVASARARRRCSPSATVRRSGTRSRGGGSRRAGSARRSSTCAPSAIGVIEETGLLPHLNPGVMTYEELARLRHVSASMGLMLETSSRSPLPAGRAALRLARQASGRAAADDRGRRPPRDPVHHRHPRRDRGGRAGAGRVRVRDPRPPPALRAHPGGDRAELPREARHGDGGRAGARRRRVPRRGGDHADRARART